MVKNIFSTLVFSVLASYTFTQTVVLTENFDSGIPASWTLYTGDTRTPAEEVAEYTQAWIQKLDPTDNANKVASSTSYFQPEGQANRWMITEAIQLGAFGNQITWRALSHDPSFAENYKVLISTSNDPAQFQDTVKVVKMEFDSWTEHEVNLSELGFDNQVVYIAFVLTTDSGYKLYIDDIEVTKEGSLSVKDIAHTTVTVYPNPASESIHIASAAKIDAISIFSANGQCMYHTLEDESSLDRVISLENYKPGMYYVRTRSGKQQSTTPLIVK